MASINSRKLPAYVCMSLPFTYIPLTPFRSVDFSEATVTVLVGETRKVFTLHPSALASGSKFFRSAFSGPWKESSNKSITLPETQPEVFQRYAAYVYTGEIDLRAEQLDEANDPESRHLFHQLAELYALADVTLDDKALRNTVIDAILDLEGRTGYQPAFSTIQHAYDNSPGTTSLCRLLLDNALAGTDPDWLHFVWDELPETYLRALMHGWALASSDRTVTYLRSAQRPRCEYHEHDDEVTYGDTCGGKGKAMVVKLKVPAKSSARKRKTLL